MNKLTPEVERRQAVERRIATAVIDAALRAGYSISVDNGEDETQAMDSRSAILAAMFQTDDERLYLYRKPVQLSRPVGWVYFVYGNDGWDVVSDYTVNLEDIMTEANKLADKLGA